MLREPRLVYAPFEYQWAYDYWLKQQSAHWLHTEISLAEDIQNWDQDLTLTEKHVIGATLKGFTQAEVVVQDYWCKQVATWFPKPEIALMCGAFGSMEGIHQTSYAYLNDSLGLTDYAAFLQEPAAKAKIDRLMEVTTESDAEIAKSLAIFSGFTEGVSLFSSFAILLNFSRRNLLKGVGQIISFSIRDETLHSNAGCHLFREYIKEYPELMTEELKHEIEEAAYLTVQMEDAFINEAFSKGDIADFCAKDLKEFIRFRANTKLSDLGLKPVFEFEKESVLRFDWFDAMSAGTEQADFFAMRVSDYSKSDQNWDNIF